MLSFFTRLNSRLRVSVRVGAGFAVVLALLAALAGVAITSLDGIETGVGRYTITTGNALQVSAIDTTRYGRYGYRRITALLRDAGWAVNRKRVQRIWRREGLKVPQRQPKRGRLWLANGSCIRLRPVRPNHVWAYDFVEDRTRDGRKFRMLCVVDEFTREALLGDGVSPVSAALPVAA